MACCPAVAQTGCDVLYASYTLVQIDCSALSSSSQLLQNKQGSIWPLLPLSLPPCLPLPLSCPSPLCLSLSSSASALHWAELESTSGTLPTPSQLLLSLDTTSCSLFFFFAVFHAINTTLTVPQFCCIVRLPRSRPHSLQFYFKIDTRTVENRALVKRKWKSIPPSANKFGPCEARPLIHNNHIQTEEQIWKGVIVYILVDKSLSHSPLFSPQLLNPLMDQRSSTVVNSSYTSM